MKHTTLCYIEKDGKYLMLHRIKKEKDINKDKWIGIGGKVEEGETAEECVVREVEEETGLILMNYKYRAEILFCPNTDIEETMHLFTATAFEGKIKEACDEGVLKWIEKEDVYNLPSWAGDKIFLEKIKTDCPFFHLILEYEGDKLYNAVLDGKEIKL